MLPRKVVSYLAGFHTNVFFYSRNLRTRLNGIVDEEKSTRAGQKMGGLAQTAMMMAIAVSERMKVGDEFEANFTGLSHGDEVRGDYTVIIKRTKPDGN